MKTQAQLEQQLIEILEILDKQSNTAEALITVSEGFKSFIPEYPEDLQTYVNMTAFLSLYAERTISNVKKLIDLGIPANTKILHLHGTAILSQEDFKKICKVNFENI